MCEVSFDSYSEIWRQTPRTARREHTCSSCCAQIHVGDAYMEHFSLYEGDPAHEKICFQCWWVQEKFGLEHGATPVPSTIAEYLRECVIENDDHADPWRGDLAGILSRYRVSEVHRRNQRKKWAERHSLLRNDGSDDGAVE